MPKKNYEKTYYKTEVYRNRSDRSTRFPDYLIRNIVLSDRIHDYIEERIQFDAPITLDVAAFLNDDGDSMTLVIGVPYDKATQKQRTLERFTRDYDEENKW